MQGLSRVKKIDWRRGSAELISIALVLPLICIILLLCIGVMQTGIMRQSLEYTTYLAARAAVTCSDETTAKEQATSAALETLRASSFGVNNADVSLTLVSGTSSPTGGSGIRWEKGALAKLQVTVSFYSLSSIEEKEMTSTMYMMVEQPATTY